MEFWGFYGFKKVMEGDGDQCQIQLWKWSQGESNANDFKKKPSKELDYFLQGLGL